MEYYSAIKENENLPFVTTWMNHEGIMLSEISHTEKDKYHMISFIYGTLKLKKFLNNKKITNLYMQRTNWWLPKERGRGVGKMGEGILTSSYKISKSWGCSV